MEKIKKKLTDRICKAAFTRGKPYEIFDSMGLFLLVNPSGSKVWNLKYRFDGEDKTISLGLYSLGNCRFVTLREARSRAQLARLVLQNGIDPRSIAIKMSAANRKVWVKEMRRFI